MMRFQWEESISDDALSMGGDVPVDEEVSTMIS